MKRHLLLGMVISLNLFAKPTHLKVCSGSAHVQHFDHHTDIKTSDKAILHWEDFSIAKKESVHFAQKHARSSVLNRVTGKNASKLLGSLTSNGAVFLINPYGIYIGGSAQIATGGFLASTADLANDIFLQGKDLVFQNPGKGTITNKGSIHCPKGDIYLIAKTIQNEGILTGANITLVSGQEIVIKPKSKQVLIRPKKEQSIEGIAAALQKESPYTLAINHTGHIEAQATLEENGRIYLVAEKGKVEIDGSLKGQKTFVFGKKVHLTKNAHIDASGRVGGTVLIGGDDQGKNSPFPNAQRVVIEKGSTVYADGTKGGGGKIVAWGDQGLFCEGFLSTQALGKKGDGGFIEVSSPGFYHYRGFATAFAKNGKTGTFLMDPVDITISSAGLFLPIACPITVFSPGASTTILDANISAHLGTCNLTINTSGGVGGVGTVTFGGASPCSISWGSGNIFTVNADRNILVNSNASITATGAGNIVFNANTAGTTTGDFHGIFVDSGIVSTVGGDVLFDAISGDSSGNKGIYLSGDGIGNTLISSDSGMIDLQGVSRGTGNRCDGISLDDSGEIVSSTSATITLNGTASTSASDDNAGVYLEGGSPSITSLNGAMSITGVASGSGIGNDGIFFDGASITSTGTATIDLVGSVGVGPTLGNNGISLETSSSISSVDGNVSLLGTTKGTASSNDGIQVQSNSQIISTGLANITLDGTGGDNGGSDNRGVILQQSAVISSINGNIQVTGQGGASGASLQGILIRGAANINATGTGSITLDGTGGAGTSLNDGILITGTNSEVTSLSGNITITGTSSGTADSNSGMRVESSGQVNTTSGTITINATGASGGTGCEGFEVVGSGSQISAGNGGVINITGNGNGTGISNEGIEIGSAAMITATGNAPITLTGTGSPSASGASEGVEITGTLSGVNSESGAISITGTSGGGTAEGVIVSSGGNVSATTGSITVDANSDILVLGVGTLPAVIGNPGTSAVTATAPISLSASDNIIITGGAGVDGYAQVGHVNHVSGASVLGGNITLDGRANVEITGGGDSSAYARAGHGGQAGGATINAHTLSSTAGVDMIMTSNTGEAQVVNSNGPVTIIVDDLFPTSPGIGLGAFVLNSLLSSTGEMRIYTARRAQNTINDTINGVVFVPGPFDVDSPTETWGTYFPDGAYGGQAFNFYYKDGSPPNPPSDNGGNGNDDGTNRMIFENIAANFTQLADLLPFSFPSHHFSMCVSSKKEGKEELDKKRDCDPNFSPYGSLIFEDDIYWIQEKGKTFNGATRYIFEKSAYYQ